MHASISRYTGTLACLVIASLVAVCAARGGEGQDVNGLTELRANLTRITALESDYELAIAYREFVARQGITIPVLFGGHYPIQDGLLLMVDKSITGTDWIFTNFDNVETRIARGVNVVRYISKGRVLEQLPEDAALRKEAIVFVGSDDVAVFLRPDGGRVTRIDLKSR